MVGMNEGETYAENTKLCGCLLIAPPGLNDDGVICKAEDLGALDDKNSSLRIQLSF